MTNRVLFFLTSWASFAYPTLLLASDYRGRARYLPDDDEGSLLGDLIILAWFGILFALTRADDYIARIVGKRFAAFLCSSIFTFVLIGGVFVFPVMLMLQYTFGIKLSTTAHVVAYSILAIASFLLCSGKLAEKET